LAIQAVAGSLVWLAASSDAEAADEQTVLRIGTLQGIAMLNPFRSYEDSEYIVWNLIYDRLVTYDEDLNIMPLIATSWEVGDWADADDPGTPLVDEGKDRLWVYHIVENATWHDGEPLTAEDVAYSIGLNLEENMWAFSPYINSKWADHATAVDDYTVEVYLRVPSVHAEALSILVVPKHIWSAYTSGEIQNSVRNENPVGSGPFSFVEIEEDNYVILEKNPDYFLGPVAYDRLVFRVFGSHQIMAESLKAGDIDAAKFPPLTFEQLKEEEGIVTAEVDKNYQSTLGFNCYTDPGSMGNRLLLDDNIRRAMHMAIDKEYLIDAIWLGYADIGYALPAPVMGDYHWEPTAEEELAFNVTRANELLNASGYDKWVGGVRVVNSTNPYAALGSPLSFDFMIRQETPEDIAAAPLIVDMWDEIGVEGTIRYVEESVMETEVYYEFSHEAYMWYWSGDFDPNYLLGVMTTEQIAGWNDPAWSNESYDEKYYLQMSQDGAERLQTVFDMQKIWYESSGMICLSYPYGLYAWTTENFEGWGDPVAHPGRTIEAYNGAAPVYMELTPVEQDGDGGGGISTTALMGIGIGVAVVVAIVAALMLMKRKKAGGAAEKEERKTGLE